MEKKKTFAERIAVLRENSKYLDLDFSEGKYYDIAMSRGSVADVGFFANKESEALFKELEKILNG